METEYKSVTFLCDVIKKLDIQIEENEKRSDFMPTVSDFVKENEPDTIVKIEGRNPDDDCDCLVEEYYYGRLDGVPADLLEYEVLSTGWLVGAQCFGIDIAYIRK